MIGGRYLQCTGCVRHTVPSAHKLWQVGRVVEDPGHEALVHPQKCRLYGVESTGEIKDHDPHSRPLRCQVDRQTGPIRGRRWTRTNCAKVFIRCEVRANGLLLLKSFRWGILGTQVVFHSSGFGLMLKMYSTILHSWSAQDLRSLELIPSLPITFFAFIFLSLFHTWIVERERFEQGGCMSGGGGGWMSRGSGGCLQPEILYSWSLFTSV